MPSHPEQEQLLRYADGELASSAAARVRAHLEACWQCRVELDELQDTVGACVRYRKNVLGGHLPAPPAPWGDIRRRFAGIDAELAQSSLRTRAAEWLRRPLRGVARWAPAAAALAMVCLLAYRFRQAPAVEAAELLRKAAAAAEARPPQPRRIRIRTRDRQLTRPAAWRWTPAANSADAVELARIFQAARYDWADPLSAKSYGQWSGRLSDKREEVIEEADGYRIRTHTRSGELVEATLKIRTADLRPVEERLEFRNRDWVEITEVTEEAAPAPAAIASTHAGAKDRKPVADPPEQPATVGDELRVLAALHQVGADLGDPIEVSRAGKEILVAGVAIAPERQQQIREALSSEKRAVVRFTGAGNAPIEPEGEAPADKPAGADAQQWQNRLAEQVGGRELFTRLAADALDLSEPMMARAYALRRLAERIPVESEAELTAPERRMLSDMRREHTAALQRQVAGIDRLLRPALGAADAPAAGTPAVFGAWQPATEDLFQNALRVDRLLSMMFGAAPAESKAGQLRSQLMAGLAQLRVKLDAYGRIPAPERSQK